MSLRFSLREHDCYANASYPPDIRFNKDGGASKIRIDSYTGGAGSVGYGYCFIVCDRAWLNGKYIRWNWNGYCSDAYTIAYARIYDGEYDRSSDTDFPSGAALLTKGNGLLQTLASKTGEFAAETQDVLVDVSGGNQDKCTIFFCLYDTQGFFAMYLDIDWVEINTGSGGNGNIYSEQFTDSVTMERTGTLGDYGYISTGGTPQFLSPTTIASAEALGSPQLNLKLFAQGIPSAEAFGVPLVIPGAVIIQPSGIASLEAFGTPLILYDQVIIPTGIASAEAFGTPTISFILLIKPKSIPSAEAFGTLKVLREIIHIILDGQYTRGSPGVNRIYIIGKDSEGNPVYGTSLNQAEIDLVGERLDFNQDLSIPTTAKAADVAAAAVAKARLTGSRGFIVIPPNCGQELWDVVQVTDKPTAQSQQKYRVIAVGFDYEPRRARYQHKLILGAP